MAVQQKQTIGKTMSLIAVTFVITLAVVTMVELIQPVETIGSQLEQSVVPVLSPDIDTDWRYTKNGWQQIGGLYRADFAPLRTFESIHPFLWAAAVMMAVVGTTVWASSEWEIARFWKRDEY